jgi:hypothetical protein
MQNLTVRLLALILWVMSSSCGSAFAASRGPGGCKQRPHPEYDRKIKELTTEPFFTTELVDHLPADSCVPSPDKHLGHIVGEPDVLTHVDGINRYMRLLEKSTARVKVFSIGKSEEGREILLVAVSDQANIARLDHYRDITAKLADPRTISEAEARKLVTEGKPFYWAAGGTHSPEVASPEMLMELAYRLAVEPTPLFEKIRKDSIVLITPVVEADGRDRMVDLYHYRKKHPETRYYPLTWWGHYVAHDNNRDGMTLALAMSRHMMATFLRFHPTVFHDLHESVPYLYISTGTGPYNAWLDPITINEWQELAHHEVQELTKRGVVGVWTYGFYDGWAPNYMFYLANGHNSIGRFYETFGDGADTKIKPLQPAQTQRQWYRPNPPLSKVKWSLRNNINLSQSGILIGMHNLAVNGQRFLQNFYLKSKRSVEKATREGPAAWVFPADDPRPVEQARLLGLLKLQGVEVHRSSQEIRVKEPVREPPRPPDGEGAPADAPPGEAEAALADQPPSGERKPEKKEKEKEVVCPAGSYVVRMDQPYSRMADMMLDTQYYNPRDPRSYDDTGWTLGALRNVRTVRALDPAVLETPMAKVAGDIVVVGGIEGEGSTYLVNHNTDNTLATLRFRLPKVKMDAAEEPFELDGVKFKAGTFVIREVERAALEKELRELGLRAHATAGRVPVSTHELAVPRIALLHNWQSTQNDGWFRIAFDVLKIPYTYLADTALRRMGDLQRSFDVIIVPPTFSSLASAIRGIPERGPPMPWKKTAETPHLWAPGLSQSDDIRGGLGYQGLEKLQRFVAEGGLLIAITSSTVLPIQAGMTEMVSVDEQRQAPRSPVGGDGAPPQGGLQAPGSVLLAKFDDRRSPIAYGYDDKLPIYFRQGPVLRVSTGYAPEEPEGEAARQRASGRGGPNDPDVIQGRRAYKEETRPRRTPAQRELFVPEDQEDAARRNLPPRDRWPRVVLRFAPERELLLSGMITGGSALAEKPAVIDVPSGKGHVVLFANNPMWRDETMGSFFLLFNAALNYQHLHAGRSPVAPPPRAPAPVAGAAGQ